MEVKIDDEENFQQSRKINIANWLVFMYECAICTYFTFVLFHAKCKIATHTYAYIQMFE